MLDSHDGQAETRDEKDYGNWCGDVGNFFFIDGGVYRADVGDLFRLVVRKIRMNQPDDA